MAIQSFIPCDKASSRCSPSLHQAAIEVISGFLACFLVLGLPQGQVELQDWQAHAVILPQQAPAQPG